MSGRTSEAHIVCLIPLCNHIQIRIRRIKYFSKNEKLSKGLKKIMDLKSYFSFFLDFPCTVATFSMLNLI